MWIFSSLPWGFVIFRASSPHLSPHQEALRLRGNVRLLQVPEIFLVAWSSQPAPTHTRGAFELLIKSSCSMCNPGTAGKRLRSPHSGQALVSPQPSITARALMKSRRDPDMRFSRPVIGGWEILIFFFFSLRKAGEQANWQSSCHKE